MLDDNQHTPPDFRYWYDARVRSVYDADTIRVDLDLGAGIVMRGPKGTGEQLRLFGIDAWEIRGSERPHGLEAKDFVVELIDGKDVVINTIADKSGKYGRLLAIVYVEHEGVWLCINEELVANGYAERKDY